MSSKPIHFRHQNGSKHVNSKVKLANKLKIPSNNAEVTEKYENMPKPVPQPDGWIPQRNWHQYLSGEPAPLSPTKTTLHRPPTSLDTTHLPTHVCSAGMGSVSGYAPTILDLCDEDKKRIALLVEEIAKYKQEKSEDEHKILQLKCKVSKLKTTLKSLEEEKNKEHETLVSLKSDHSKEQCVLKDQLAELKLVLTEVQTQKTASDSQSLRIARQSERLTHAIHTLHRENLRLKEEVVTSKDRLEVAQLALEKMTKELQSVQDRIKPSTDDKACQSTEDLMTERVYIKQVDTPNKDSREEKLLSELFFNNDVHKNLSSKETIIFLPATTNLHFTQF